MNQKKYYPWAFALSLGGVLFAGYLSSYKLFTKTCAFGESCPIFLGYPACYYGFAMFLTLFIASAVGLFGKSESAKATAMKVNAWVSLAGIIFAGSLTFGEVWPWFTAGVKFYDLGLPTCSYGLVFYVILFVLTARALKVKTASAAPTASAAK